MVGKLWVDLCSEGLTSIRDSEDRSQPPGNCARLESVGMDTGVSEGRRGQGSI